jgi:ParB-like chromosome segregation protein Spo0J
MLMIETDQVFELDSDTEEDTVAVRDTRVEALLDQWSLPYELEQDFALTKIKREGATQIRLEAHQAPAQAVDEYMTHMKHGAIFPPIVISHQGYLVDGNTRLAAANRLGRKTFAVYKVKFAHLGQAKMIGAALNQMGGDRLTEEEIVAAAEVMMKDSYGDEAIARTLGRSVSHIRNVRKDRTYRDAANRTGLSHLKIPKPTQRILANIAHDEPFRAAVEAVVQAKPSTKDVSALVNRIEETRSDADALAAIQTVTTNWGPVTGAPPNKKSLSKSQARKGLALAKQLVKLGADPGMLVVSDAEAIAIWQQVVSIATHVVALSTRPVA